jgi:hypothetical protein
MKLARRTAPIVIDVSSTRQLDEIPVPKGNKWDGNYLTIYDVNLSIRLPRGLRIDDHVFSIGFERENGQLKGVQINFDTKNIENTYELLSRFAANWRLPMTKIDKWKADVIGGKWNGVPVKTIDNSQQPCVAVEIFESYDFDSSKPSRVILELVWQ